LQPNTLQGRSPAHCLRSNAWQGTAGGFSFINKTPEEMKQKEITVNGKNYPVIFTLATLSNFEEITGKPFFKADLDMLKNRIAIICAAAIAADENTKLTVEELRGNEDLEAYKQIATVYNTIIEMAAEFFHIPSTEKKEAEQPAEEEEKGDAKPKN
jgi:hypothetical protein